MIQNLSSNVNVFRQMHNTQLAGIKPLHDAPHDGDGDDGAQVANAARTTKSALAVSDFLGTRVNTLA